MAPITAVTAKLAYDKAAANLKQACTGLERQIPPSDSGEDEDTPPLVPRARGNSVAACVLCAAELEKIAPGHYIAIMSTHVYGQVCLHICRSRSDEDWGMDLGTWVWGVDEDWG